MQKPQDKKKLNIKPAGSYLDSLSEFASLLGTIRQADDAAKEMIRETDKNGKKTTAGKPSGSAPPSKSKKAEPEKKEQSSGGGKAPDEKAPAEEEQKPKPDVDTLLKELDGLVGLKKIKENVRSLVNLVKVRQLREKNGLPVPEMSLHMVFMGNPGTGKTTVARLIAQLYYAIGVLSKGQLVEVDRSGLVAGFVGQTAIKTDEAVKRAMGGVLFVDEAYSLVSGDGSNDFGHEAVETLLKAMEDNRLDLVVIVAGYEELMEKFISSNPGLESRFNRYFIFEDYNGDELLEIFSGLCEKNKYMLSEEAQQYAKEHFDQLYGVRDENFGNARDVRNFFENVVSVHADRVSAIKEPTRKDLTTVLKSDMEKAAEL